MFGVSDSEDILYDSDTVLFECDQLYFDVQGIWIKSNLWWSN